MQFVRTVASLSSIGAVWTALFKQLQWKRCVLISSTENVYWQTSVTWTQQLTTMGIAVERQQTFKARQLQMAEDSPVVAWLDIIRKSTIRVVIVLAPSDDAAVIAKLALGSAKTSAPAMTLGWAWLGTTSIVSAESTPLYPMHGESLRSLGNQSVLDGWLYVTITRPNPSTLADFYSQVRSYSKKVFNVSSSSVNSYADELYNSIFLYAHAVTRVLNATGEVRDSRAIVQAMKEVSFEGIEHRIVEIDHNGDGIVPLSVMNYVEQDGRMHSVVVGNYSSGRLDLRSDLVRWPGKTGSKPGIDIFFG